MAISDKLPSNITHRLRGASILAVIAWSVWYLMFSYNTLFHAAGYGCSADVRAVLDRGVSANARDPLVKNTALIVAASSNNPCALENIKILLAHGADINAKNVFGNTALMLAVDRRRTAVVDSLLNSGADAALKNKNGRTALSLAMSRGWPDMTLQLRNYMQHQARP